MNEIVFNPEQSANIVKEKLQVRSRISLEIVSELYKARDYYSNSGYRSDLVPNSTRLTTFDKYLNYIGLARRTGYNWLERYIPEENKLLTYEELQSKKQIEIDNRKTKEQREHEERLKQIKEDEKEFEKLYYSNKNIMFDNKDKQIRWERFKNAKDFIESEKEKYKENDNKNDPIDSILDFIDNEQEKINERIKYNSKIKDMNMLYDIIEDYLFNMNNDQKLECYNSIIKYCRNKANKLHRNS